MNKRLNELEPNDHSEECVLYALPFITKENIYDCGCLEERFNSSGDECNYDEKTYDGYPLCGTCYEQNGKDCDYK